MGQHFYILLYWLTCYNILFSIPLCLNPLVVLKNCLKFNQYFIRNDCTHQVFHSPTRQPNELHFAPFLKMNNLPFSSMFAVSIMVAVNCVIYNSTGYVYRISWNYCSSIRTLFLAMYIPLNSCLHVLHKFNDLFSLRHHTMISNFAMKELSHLRNTWSCIWLY